MFATTDALPTSTKLHLSLEGYVSHRGKGEGSGMTRADATAHDGSKPLQKEKKGTKREKFKEKGSKQTEKPPLF